MQALRERLERAAPAAHLAHGAWMDAYAEAQSIAPAHAAASAGTQPGFAVSDDLVGMSVNFAARAVVSFVTRSNAHQCGHGLPGHRWHCPAIGR